MPIPTHFLFEVTGKCSAECRYCYARDRSDAPHAPPRLVEQFARRLLEETEVAGVTLIGGEPLEHPELAHIAASLGALGIRVAITTNGHRLSSNRIEELLRAGVRYFEVSLDTLDADVYRALGRGDDVEVVKLAVAELARRGAHVTVSAVVHRPGVEGLDDLIDFCFAVGAAGLSLLRPLGRQDDGFALTDAELAACLARCDERAGLLGLPIACSVPIEACRFPTDRPQRLVLSPCACGESKWVVDPAGYLRACELSPQRLGSVLDEGFAKLRDSPEATAFRQQNRGRECLRCPHLTQCGGGCRFAC